MVQGCPSFLSRFEMFKPLRLKMPDPSPLTSVLAVRLQMLLLRRSLISALRRSLIIAYSLRAG